MKTKSLSNSENTDSGIKRTGIIRLNRAKEIAKEEEIEYSDEELTEILEFISKVISITTCHYERVKQNDSKLVSINTNKTHETESIPLHSSKYRRAS